MLIVIYEGRERKLFLPGDCRELSLYNSCKLVASIKPIRDMLQNIANIMQPFMNQLIIQFRDIMAETNDNMKEMFKELSGSIKETMKEIEKRYPKNPDLLGMPPKVMKATRMNRKVNKRIYYHIRSNC